MPSPIAHTAMVPWLLPAARDGRGAELTIWQKRLLLLAVVGACLMPDFDIAIDWLVLGNDPFANHGGVSHSLAAIAVLPLVWAGLTRLLVPVSFVRLYVVGVIAHASHVLMDLGNAGRGIMALWPLSDERVLLPVRLFMGVSHSDPSNWVHHILTLATELAFFGAMWLAARWWWWRRRSGGERQTVVTQAEVG